MRTSISLSRQGPGTGPRPFRRRSGSPFRPSHGAGLPPPSCVPGRGCSSAVNNRALSGGPGKSGTEDSVGDQGEMRSVGASGERGRNGRGGRRPRSEWVSRLECERRVRRGNPVPCDPSFAQDHAEGRIIGDRLPHPGRRMAGTADSLNSRSVARLWQNRGSAPVAAWGRGRGGTGTIGRATPMPTPNQRDQDGGNTQGDEESRGQHLWLLLS